MATAVISTVVATIQGCGNGAAASGSDAEPHLGPIPVIEHSSDASLPLDRYRVSPEQWVTLNKAADLVVRNCMKRFGFEYDLPDRRAGQGDDRAIGLVDELEAAEFGYKNPRMQQQVKAAEAEKAQQRKSPRPPEVVHVLTGEGPARFNGVEVPEGGCYGEARRAFGSSERSDGGVAEFNFVLRLGSESSQLAEVDSRLRGAFSQWSHCMAEAGFDYSDPWGANDDPAFGGETASAAEIATARADVKCRKKHNVNGMWVAVRTAYQHRLIEQNAEALRHYEHEVGEQLRKAADIVAGG